MTTGASSRPDSRGQSSVKDHIHTQTRSIIYPATHSTASTSTASSSRHRRSWRLFWTWTRNANKMQLLEMQIDTSILGLV